MDDNEEKRGRSKMLTVKISPDTHKDFSIAANLKGQTMSAVIHQFVRKIIREEKDKHPEAFPDFKVDEPLLVNSERFREIAALAFSGKDLTQDEEASILRDLELLLKVREAEREGKE